MGYLYNELLTHNERCHFLSAIHVPPVPIPTDFYTPTKLEILETQFFTNHLWYMVYYNSSKHISVYQDLIEMWRKCSNVLTMTEFGVGIPPRYCGRSMKYLGVFARRIIDIKRSCDDAHIKIPEYLEHEPINTYDVVSDWKSSMREAICASLGLPTPGTSRFYVPITYGRDPIVRDNVRLVINILMNFNYRRWKYKDIKAWNLRWEDDELMFYQGSMIYGYMQKCIAVRNW